MQRLNNGALEGKWLMFKFHHASFYLGEVENVIDYS